MASPSPRRLARVWATLLGGLVLVLGAAACSEDSSGTADRAANVYGAMLTWVLDEELPLPAPVEGETDTALVTEADEEPGDDEGGRREEDAEEDEDLPPVYLVGLHREISLQVQVELVSRFEARGYDLRFLDGAEEALDEAEPNVPVRDGGLLVGLGPIPEGRRVDVRAEVYRSLADLDAYRFSLARWGGVWSLVEEPTPVEAEGFVATP